MIGQKEFAVVALDPGKEVFVIYIAYLKAKILIHPIQKAQITLLLAKKVIVLTKYSDFANVFSKKSVTKLFKISKINKYIIDLELGKQLLYRPIYSLKIEELETLKT